MSSGGSAGHVARLKLTDIDTEPGFDFVTVYDGATDEPAELLQKLSGTASAPVMQV